MHHWFPVSFFNVASNLGCALIQLHTCACNMYLISSFNIKLAFQADWSWRLTQTRICSPSSCTYNSRTLKKKVFLLTSSAFSILV